MARSFDGSTSYLLSSGVPDGVFPLSMACLVRFNSTSGLPYFFQYGMSSNASARLGLSLSSTGALDCSLRDTGTAIRTWTTTATIPTGMWVSVVGTFTNDTTCVGYIDGVSTGSYTALNSVTLPAFNRCALGALPRSTISNFLDGQIAEAAIWNATLSADDIGLLTARISPMMVRPADLRAYWPLHGRNGASGNEEDWVGGHTMTQNSSPTLSDHPRIIYPRRRTAIWVPPVASGAPNITALSARLITATSVQPRISYS